MGYYSEVALALPESELNALITQCAKIEYSVFDHVDSKTWFDRTDVDFYDNEEDNVEKWVLLRWNYIQWNPFLNKSIQIIEDYLDEEEGPYEYLRLGEDINVESHSCGVSENVLGISATIETYI